MANQILNFQIWIIFFNILFFDVVKGQQQFMTTLCPSSSNLNTNKTESSNSDVTSSSSSIPICECINESSSPWGLRIQRIDCSNRNITYNLFKIKNLPFATEDINFSWNQFNEIPNLYGIGLKRLKFCHNYIQKLSDGNFKNLPNLRDLDLSWNQIELLSFHTFIKLDYLQRLDLSHNNLKRIVFDVFTIISSLEDLNLSWNPNLIAIDNNNYGNSNNDDPIIEHDFYLPLKLKSLKLSHCNLQNNQLYLSNGINLEKLYLDWNNLTIIPSLPQRLKLLDISGNPLEELESKTLPHLFQLQTLLIEDMPKLKQIDDYSFFGLPIMKKLSLQNSRKLEKFHSYAFGMNVILNETDIILEELNLCGTNIKTLNKTLYFTLHNLKILNLAGTPLMCNCDLYWIKKLNIDETNGRCSEPTNLRGWKLSKVSEQQFNCNNTPQWIANFLNSLLIILLILLCVCGIWLIVLGLRPKKVIMRKIGATSPYAPVTIEPNRAEY